MAIGLCAERIVDNGFAGFGVRRSPTLLNSPNGDRLHASDYGIGILRLADHVPESDFVAPQTLQAGEVLDDVSAHGGGSLNLHRMQDAPSPSRIPEFASSDFTMESPFASAYFPTSISRSLAQSNSPLGFAGSRSDE